MRVMSKEKEIASIYVKALVKVSKVLQENNVDFVLIGSMILPVVYKVPWNVHDIDLFILNKSTLLDSEFFENLANENDWDFGTTMHGLIYYEVVIDGNVVRVDLMENILDIYIPKEMLSKAISVEINGIKVKSIKLEELIVLKAREATEESDEFLSKVAEMLADPEVNLKINKDRLKEIINYFPEEERESIARRIERSGIYLE